MTTGPEQRPARESLRQTVQRSSRRLFLLAGIWDTELVELMAGAKLTLWGLWVANPWIVSFSSAMRFHALRDLHISEWAYGGIAFVIGSFQLYALWRQMESLRTRNLQKLFRAAALRKLAALFSAMFLFFHALAVTIGDYRDPASIMYWLLSFAMTLVYSRIVLPSATGSSSSSSPELGPE